MDRCGLEKRLGRLGWGAGWHESIIMNELNVRKQKAGRKQGSVTWRPGTFRFFFVSGIFSVSRLGGKEETQTNWFLFLFFENCGRYWFILKGPLLPCETGTPTLSVVYRIRFISAFGNFIWHCGVRSEGLSTVLDSLYRDGRRLEGDGMGVGMRLEVTQWYR